MGEQRPAEAPEGPRATYAAKKRARRRQQAPGWLRDADTKAHDMAEVVYTPEKVRTPVEVAETIFIGVMLGVLFITFGALFFT